MCCSPAAWCFHGMKLRFYVLVWYAWHDKTGVLEFAKPVGKMLGDSAEQKKTDLVHSCPYCLLGDIARVEYLRQNTLIFLTKELPSAFKNACEWIHIYTIWRISESRPGVRWGVRWWCRPTPTPMSVCKLEWFSGHSDVWKNTWELSIQMLWLQPQHWGFQPLWKQILSSSCNPALNGKHAPGFGFSLWTRRRKRQQLPLS